MNENRAPSGYFGGKFRLLPQLTSYIPSDLDCYVEPFFGMGSLFFSSPHWAENEVINDLNGDIYNFFCALRDQYPKLKRLLHFTPYDAQTFGNAKRIIKDQRNSSVRRAWAMYVLLSQSILNNGRSFARGSVDKSKPQEFKRAVKRLEYCAERLRDAIIENEQAVKVCRRCDSGSTFFYLDPPYLKVRNLHSMKSAYRGTVPSEDVHTELLDWAREAKGFVLISNYPNPLYDKILKDWHRQEVEISTNPPRGARGAGSATSKSIEVIWSNQKRFDVLKYQPSLFDW